MMFYDAPPAPSPRRVRMFIAEKGLDIPVTNLDLAKGDQLTDDFKKVNPRCTVPVLQLDDGTCLTETMAICRYLELEHPGPNLMGETSKEQALVQMWYDIVLFDGFAGSAEALRNFAKMFKDRSITGAASFPQIPELAERGRIRAASFLDDMNERLGVSEYVALDRFTLADINAFVCVEFAGWIKVPIKDEHQHLRRWFDGVAARPSASA